MSSAACGGKSYSLQCAWLHVHERILANEYWHRSQLQNIYHCAHPLMTAQVSIDWYDCNARTAPWLQSSGKRTNRTHTHVTGVTRQREQSLHAVDVSQVVIKVLCRPLQVLPTMTVPPQA